MPEFINNLISSSATRWITLLLTPILVALGFSSQQQAQTDQVFVWIVLGGVAWLVNHYGNFLHKGQIAGAASSGQSNSSAAAKTITGAFVLLVMSQMIGCAADKDVYAARAGYNSSNIIYANAIVNRKLPLSGVNIIEPLRKAADAVLAQEEQLVRSGQKPSSDLVNTVLKAVDAFTQAVKEQTDAATSRPSSGTSAPTSSSRGNAGPQSARYAGAMGPARCDDQAAQRRDRQSGGGLSSRGIAAAAWLTFRAGWRTSRLIAA